MEESGYGPVYDATLTFAWIHRVEAQIYQPSLRDQIWAPEY
jgi:hypothetical protein